DFAGRYQLRLLRRHSAPPEEPALACRVDDGDEERLPGRPAAGGPRASDHRSVDRYRVAAGLPVATDPWTDLYDYRCLLAHSLPELLDSERVWHDTVGDVGRLRRAVEQQRAEETR
ncbi:MAG: hypothetical protein ACYDAQ_14400, partial [Mycobacteriales bacterium]